MNDPQDLLYTNNFINTDIINDKQINEQINNYDRFVDYQSNQNTEDTNNTLRYINNDNEENDSINIQKSLYQPFPIDNNKNNYPMFDPLLNDLSKNTYTKLKDVIINIDTGYRNPIYHPLSSNFKVNLPNTYNNIHQIEISNINIPNFLKSVTSIKNNFSWQYFSDYYPYTDISYNLIPFPQNYSDELFYAYNDIKYSTYTIPFNFLEKNLDYDPTSFLTYQLNIEPGNYTIDQLKNEIESKSTKILHGNYNNNILQTKDDNNLNICEEPYFSFPYLKNSPHLWKFEINKQNGAIFLTNRMEELSIYSIQTFFNYSENSTSNYFKDNDIFYKFSSLGNDYTLDSKYIYITIPFIQNISDNWFDNSNNKDNINLYPDNNYNNPFEINPFPLVMTCDFKNINNEILKIISQFTMTTFWDLRIYNITPFTDSSDYPNFILNEDKLKNLSYYFFSDIITIPNLDFKLLRFALRWAPVSSKGIPFQNFMPKPDYGYFKPSNMNTTIFKKSINDYFINNNLNNIFYDFNDLDISIGRSLPCRFIYGKENNKFQHFKSEGIDEKKNSILEYFNFSIANSTNGDIRNIYNRGFGFIHSNLYGSKLNKNLPINQFIESLGFFNTKQVNFSLKIIDNNNFYLKNNNYVYLKISFDGIDLSKLRQNQNQVAFSENQFHVNQNYSNTPLVNYLGIGESIECYKEIFEIKTKNYDGIFCKIFTSTIPGDINILDNNISSKIIFNAYDNLLNDISNIKIEILDSNLKVIETEENYSFDLKFIYSDSKLKETNINTKTNKIDLVGTNY